ncbi:alpha-amylase family glycosyl hydrolase [uncultured Flavobacterium sp.]|uniref:alpha-amylase family glycosyl hydrolase n=1 Tax=uncultured Flavobacterium sp. TaxID=165435 RepID=UPI0025F7AE4C|nr:alpha-amylase family glycosyl hydrolase [uncultured Flavobacterium sp.]
MKHLLQKFSYCLFLLAAIGTQAQNTSVQFQVNMNHQVALGNFNPGSQTVDVAGSFNNWGSPTTMLSDTDGDGIYTGSVSLAIGSTIQFKTRINAQWNGTEEFAGGGPNRTYTVMPNGVAAYWYNDELPANILNIRAEANAYVVQPGQAVHYFDRSAGNPVAWQWSMPGATPETSELQNPEVSYASPGNYSITLTVTNAEGESSSQAFTNFIRVDPMVTHWWNDRVFYEVFVRSFSDSNGDGRGDLQGLIDKLDYLNDGNPDTTTDLGITGIWLMPVQQSPSYHGYDVSDYMTVEQDYGNNPKFIEFMQAAHARGIKVIIDMVMNHTSDQHPWFVSSKNPGSDKRDWYIWEDNNPGTPGPFENYPWHNANGDWYYGAFFGGMPDLNFYNPEVHTAFEEITEFWLNDMGVDGFRLDAVKFLHENGTSVQNTPETIAYWQEFRAFYKSVKPDAFAVGEAWDLTSIASQYVNDNGLDYCFEFELADSILNGLNSGSAADLSDQMKEVMKVYPFLQFGTILGNHDTNRVMSVFNNDMAKMKAASALLLTLPGIPYIYYGEEIGMTGVKPDELLRKPMQWTGTTGAGFTTGTPWQSINSDYTTKNVAAQQANETSLWHHYRDLISIRQSENALTKGTYKAVNTSSSALYAFLRQYEGENILVVANMGGTALNDVTVSMPAAGIAPGDYTGIEMMGGSPLSLTFDASGGLAGLPLNTLPARSVMIYKFAAPLGTKDNNATIANLYPNPAGNSFSFTIGTEKADVYSLTGQLVKSYGAANAGAAFDISGLAKGLYLVKVTDANGKVSTMKLLKE